MERYRRMRDLEGLPTISIESPAEFFAAAELDYPDAATWVGELYFEMHRGTYTSQAKTKTGNRKTEILLGEVELWSTLAASVAAEHGFEYPYDELEAAWREVLTLQFHDIIPGSSIAWVHDDAEAAYARLGAELTELRDGAVGALAPFVGGDVVLANSAPHDRREVIVVADALAPVVGIEVEPVAAQQLHDGSFAVWGEIGPMSVAALHWNDLRSAAAGSVVVEQDDGVIVLDNELIRVTIDADGLVTSLVDLRNAREVIKPGCRANLLELSSDHPIEYDAWDLDEYYANSTVELTGVDSITVLDDGPLVATVRVMRSFGSSQIEQAMVLRAGSARLDFVTRVDWHENEKVLKAAMPVDVRADRASCEIQFGTVERPTHASTNWDAAKFEVCAHRWVDVSEHDYGVALLNDCKYGHDIHRGALRITLLRAPNFPDPDADRGEHRFTYSLYPHVGGLAGSDVIAEAARLNQPVVAIRGGVLDAVEPSALTAVTSSSAAVVITALKLAEDGSGDIIVRAYESWGGRATSVISTAFATTDVTVCNFLELPLDDEADAAWMDGDDVVVELRPFQIITLRLS